jgi:hypothetical protein
MSPADDVLFRAILVGVGGTVVLDLWAEFLARVMGVPATNWAMVGRWLGNMPRGRFVQRSMTHAEPVRGELAIGWVAHYVIGILYGLLLLALWGPSWIARPTLLPPVILAWVLLASPYLIMMPGMGAGIAGAKTPKPNVTRLKALVAHSVFGLGMYAVAVVLTWVKPNA